MNLKTICLLLSMGAFFTAKAQLNQRYDNIKYKAIYLDDASKLINKTPDLLLLDVRSPGEYADTSQYLTNNIGHLKGARNISIDSIPNHLNELRKYKDRPILVYCSHSVRSRRVSKFLTDSGFTQVYSLNGGMSLVNKSTNKEFPVKTKLYTTRNPYRLIESEDAYHFIENKNNLIIDIRPAEQFKGADNLEENNIGRIKGAINIPFSDMDKNIASLNKYKNKPILFCDLYGQEAFAAAKEFTKAGFKKVYVLFEGLSTLLPNTPIALRNTLYTGLPKYKAIGSKQAIELIKNKPGIVIADMREKAEFENKAKETYENLGHVVNAGNYTASSLFAYLGNKPKSTPILVYGSNMTGMQHGTSSAAITKQLAEKGFTNVYLIYNGMYSLVWSVTNVADSRNGRSILVDHKGLY